MSERRTQPRRNLRLPVLLLPRGCCVPVHAYTENVSVDGFFCQLEQPLEPGETVNFLLIFPPSSAGPDSSGAMCLKGTADVVRIVAGLSQATVGVAFHLSSYTVRTHSTLKVIEELVCNYPNNEPLATERQHSTE